MKVLKRNDREQELDSAKIADSIFLAAQDVGGTDRKLAEMIAKEVVTRVKKQYGRMKSVSSAEIGDMVERILLEKTHYKTAKAYILNREKKRQVEASKRALGVHDDVGLSLNALTVAKEKYLQRDNEGEVVETVGGMFERTAKFLASCEKPSKRKEWQAQFSRVMREQRFMPGGRTLANSGTANNQLANCFVMPMPDDIEGIFESLKESSILKKYGGGVGFTFGHIRPKGDKVSTTSGAACGPVALMQLINDASDIYLQAGKRRSGNMVTLPITHPDIIDFIHCKESGYNFPHINFSIAITDKFIEAVKNNSEWELINPRTGLVTSKVSARGLMEEAARMAWKNGDPGLIFIDEIEKYNPTPHVGPLETVNLCGEQPLLSYEACNLGSVNLAVHVKFSNQKFSNSQIDMAEVDWKKLEETVRVATRMLDDVVSVCEYPLTQVSDTVHGNRKIGLGVMGWADMLVKLHVAYDSPKALKLAEEVMKFVQETGHDESAKLGKEKGNFPNFKGSSWQKKGYKHFRNATVTTIAPTGTISMMAGASSGIEPHFALAYFRKSMGQYNLPEVNTDLVKAIKHVNGLYSTELMDEIARTGSIQKIDKIPKEIREVFTTAMDISPETHVQMLAAFQKYTDNAVSKTINLPAEATAEDVMNVYMMAADLKCKGITVYRDKSREIQVLNVGQVDRPAMAAQTLARHTQDESANAVTDSCPECGNKLALEEGCKKCYGCGYSVCG